MPYASQIRRLKDLGVRMKILNRTSQNAQRRTLKIFLYYKIVIMERKCLKMPLMAFTKGNKYSWAREITTSANRKSNPIIISLHQLTSTQRSLLPSPWKDKILWFKKQNHHSNTANNIRVSPIYKKWVTENKSVT